MEKLTLALIIPSCELPDVDKKEAEDNWKDFMGDFKAKTKYDRKTR